MTTATSFFGFGFLGSGLEEEKKAIISRDPLLMGGGSHEGRTFTEEQGENSTNLVVMLQKRSENGENCVCIFGDFWRFSHTLLHTQKRLGGLMGGNEERRERENNAPVE